MKLYRNSLIIILFVFSCQGTNNQVNDNRKTFDLKKLPEVTSIKLSDLGFVDIEYIQLESNEQCMISSLDDLDPGNKLVFGERNCIIQQYSTILEFKTDGKFITRIGTKGRGPDEFTAAHDVKISERNQDIYLLARWQKKIFVYAENGKLLRTFLVTFPQVNFNLLIIRYYVTVRIIWVTFRIVIL